MLELSQDIVGIRRSRQRKIYNTKRIGVVFLGFFLRYFGVRTDADRVYRVQGTGRPFTQRLPQQGDARYQEQDKAVTIGFRFGDP